MYIYAHCRLKAIPGGSAKLFETIIECFFFFRVGRRLLMSEAGIMFVWIVDEIEKEVN